MRQDIFEIQKNTSSIINQLALSVKDLIGYNKNRDEELEILLEEKLLELLEANDWEVDKINRVDMIYNSEGVVCFCAPPFRLSYAEVTSRSECLTPLSHKNKKHKN